MSGYEVENINSLLANNSYPGRGIIIGTSANGKYNVVAYFIMGRSVNSRNRVFIKENDGIRTEAYDPSKLSDPSLIIYHPVRVSENGLIVTNGDQTDTIKNGFVSNTGFFESLETREFEPDGPNWTPRISGLVKKDGSYLMSILKSVDEKGSACVRHGYSYPKVNGVGHFIHTYNCDGNPIPSFTGEPERIEIVDCMEQFTSDVWSNLNNDNKISLYVRYTDIKTGEFRDTIINKLGD